MALTQPPPAASPASRPPPSSLLSLKRQALEELNGEVGYFEATLLPRLFCGGQMVADDRILFDHYGLAGPGRSPERVAGARSELAVGSHRLLRRARPREPVYDARACGPAHPLAQRGVGHEPPDRIA